MEVTILGYIGYRIWGIWGSHYSIPKPILYQLKGDCTLTYPTKPCNPELHIPNPKPPRKCSIAFPRDLASRRKGTIKKKNRERVQVEVN